MQFDNWRGEVIHSHVTQDSQSMQPLCNVSREGGLYGLHVESFHTTYNYLCSWTIIVAGGVQFSVAMMWLYNSGEAEYCEGCRTEEAAGHQHPVIGDFQLSQHRKLLHWGQMTTYQAARKFGVENIWRSSLAKELCRMLGEGFGLGQE